MREYKPPPLSRTCASECGGTDTHACQSAARDFPELRVHSRGPLGIVNLGFLSGRVVMRFLEVACVRTSLHLCFALVPHGAVGLTLTHATPAPVISRSCASIPDLP